MSRVSKAGILSFGSVDPLAIARAAALAGCHPDEVVVHDCSKDGIRGRAVSLIIIDDLDYGEPEPLDDSPYLRTLRPGARKRDFGPGPHHPTSPRQRGGR